MATDAITSGEAVVSPDQAAAPQKVTFTSEQQERLDQLIKEAQSRAARDVRQQLAEAKEQVQILKAEIETRNTAAQHEPPVDPEKLHHELKARTAEVEHWKKLNDAARAESAAIKKHVAIQQAAARFNFVDLAAVQKLTADFIRLEGDKFVVVDVDGHERRNAAFDPMSLEEFYKDFASKNPYLVRSDFRSGSGSTESQQTILSSTPDLRQLFGPTSSGKLANDPAKRDPAKYRALRKQAQEAGLIG